MHTFVLRFQYLCLLSILGIATTFEKRVLFAAYPLETRASSLAFPEQPGKNEAFINKVTKEGFNELHTAASEGNAVKVQALAHRYVKARLINISTPAGKTALMLAAEKGNEICVKILVESGADLRKADSLLGYNALHGAISNDKDSVARYLIHLFAEKGILDVQSRGGDTALILASHYGQDLWVKALVAAGANICITDVFLDYDALHAAVSEGKASTVHYLAPLYAQIGRLNFQAHFSETPLMLAALKGHDACVKELIDAGADIGKTSVSSGRNALHLASNEGNVATVHYLAPLYAQAGLLDNQTSNGSTALMLAKSHNHDECAQEIVNAGNDTHQIQAKKRNCCAIL